MEICQLYSFITLANCLSFTQTAKSLNVSQSAVSQQIADLEKKLGVKLLQRNGKKVEITNAGRIFFMKRLK